MVKIPTVQVGQGNIPEGHYVFKIDSIDDSKYDKFGKLAINLITQDGRKHSERYQLVDSKGNLNEGAQKAWSFFVGSVLDQWGVGDADTDDLIGKYLSADVKHIESDQVSDKTGKPFINVRLENLKSETGFDVSQAELDKAINDLSAPEDDLDDLDNL